MRTTVIFDNFGPYHQARLCAAARVCELTAVQICSRSAEYAWVNDFQADGFKFATLFQQGAGRNEQYQELVQKMEATLADFHPQVVFIPGWSSRAAFTALGWCIRNRVPVVAMSESTEWDEARASWKEWLKRRLIRLCSSALVGGVPHKDYMVKLGMSADRIFLGYDTVDNRYFAQGANEARGQKTEARSKYRLPENYFLASARFIEKKNLPRLLEAYARYRELAAHSTLWDLVLLGDGALRETLNFQLSTLNLLKNVQMPGFKQYCGPNALVDFAEELVIHGLGMPKEQMKTEKWG
ncbi:MAG: glycosyltransferase [Limisphaerales bacterium]